MLANINHVEGKWHLEVFEGTMQQIGECVFHCRYPRLAEALDASAAASIGFNIPDYEAQALESVVSKCLHDTYIQIIVYPDLASMKEQLELFIQQDLTTAAMIDYQTVWFNMTRTSVHVSLGWRKLGHYVAVAPSLDTALVQLLPVLMD